LISAPTYLSSGAKSILDLPATRELLETAGVPVIGYGIDTLPAFFVRSSGLPVDIRLNTAAEVAAVIQAHQTLQLQNGILVTIPVPQQAAGDPDEIEAAIAQATREADEQGIHGPAATPWLLQKIVTLTDGHSLIANRALLQNNGLVAGQIASALSQMAKNSYNVP
jgi:pseudouridine-5'-phosphate glycosidase